MKKYKSKKWYEKTEETTVIIPIARVIVFCKLDIIKIVFSIESIDRKSENTVGKTNEILIIAKKIKNIDKILGILNQDGVTNIGRIEFIIAGRKNMNWHI